MTREELNKIWERVKTGDKDAKSILIGLYLSKFPEKIWFTEDASEKRLFIIYNELKNGQRI